MHFSLGLWLGGVYVELTIEIKE